MVEGEIASNGRGKATIGTVLSTVGITHQSICPVHGLIPNTIYFLSGVAAANSWVAETKIGQYGTAVHEWSVETVAGALSVAYDLAGIPYKELVSHDEHDHHEGHHHSGDEIVHASLETLVIPGYEKYLPAHTLQHTGSHDELPDLMHTAEYVTTGLNVAMMLIGGYVLYRGIREWRNKRQNHKCHKENHHHKGES